MERKTHLQAMPGPSADHLPCAAVFLDRDGTLIEDRGDLSEPSQVIFFPDTVPALRRLCERFRLFIVTNQSGVSRGSITQVAVDRVNAHVTGTLAQYGIPIAETYVCPHTREDQCACIKPKPYFLHRAAQTHGVVLARSFGIGDHPHDVTLLTGVGGAGVYVLTGHGRKHSAELCAPIPIAAGIREAVDYILNPDQPMETRY